MLILLIATMLAGARVKIVLLRGALPLVVRHTNFAILAWAIPFLWAIPFVACFVAWFVAMVRICLWKCPRCGRRFIGVYDPVAFLRKESFYCGPSGAIPLSWTVTERKVGGSADGRDIARSLTDPGCQNVLSPDSVIRRRAKHYFWAFGSSDVWPRAIFHPLGVLTNTSLST